MNICLRRGGTRRASRFLLKFQKPPCTVLFLAPLRCSVDSRRESSTTLCYCARVNVCMHGVDWAFADAKHITFFIVTVITWIQNILDCVSLHLLHRPAGDFFAVYLSSSPSYFSSLSKCILHLYFFFLSWQSQSPRSPPHGS